MEKRTRKKLRLQGYDYSQNGAYFITLCVQEKHPVLGKVVGADALIGPRVVLSAYGEVVREHLERIPEACQSIMLDRYVIMPNHVHMVLIVTQQQNVSCGESSVPDGPMWASAPTKQQIPNAIRSLKTVISKQLGFSIWQRSYYDHIIRSQEEYLQICKCIEENPAKWYEDTYYMQ